MQSDCAFNLSQVFGKEAVLEKRREGEGREREEEAHSKGSRRASLQNTGVGIVLSPKTD